MERIKTILKVSEQGVSRPYVCEDEEARVRWCKGNHTGLRSVMSEWICANLARELGLPVPDFDIMKLDISVFQEWRDCRGDDLPEIVTASNQFVFASLNVDDCKDVFEPASDLAHIDAPLLARIYLFDRMIRNTDRTEYNSNLLVNGSVYIIDHNNAFDDAFNESEFSKEHILRGCRDSIPADEARAFALRMADLASGRFLDDVWSEMPYEWTDAGGDILPLSRIKRILQEGADGRNI